MRIVFMGTPTFAVPTLRALVEAGHEVAAAYTQPPRPGGRRGGAPTPSPVQREAERLGIEVCHPVTLKDLAAEAHFRSFEPEVAVVAAYGLILPQAILDTPPKGCLNVHASLLPRWRGAAPIQRAILADDAITGVTIMRMEPGLDTGPMLRTARVPVEDKNAGELSAELAEVGANLMVETLAELDSLEGQPQDDTQATYAAKIDKAEARIDWTRAAEHVERQCRAFAPVPGAWFMLGGERVKLLGCHVIGVNGAPGTVLDEELTVACGDAAIRPTRLQRAGKPSMSAEEFLRGFPVEAGMILK
jgi:methionyl-tRNA formyltransferase